LRCGDWNAVVSVLRESARVGRLALFFGLFILFWLALINLPTDGFRPELDTSWRGALSYFAFKKLQFGKDVIFTYGPLGYITTDTYSGYLLASRVGFELLLKGVFALLMTSLALRLRPVLGSWFIANIAFLSPISSDAVYLFAIVLSAGYVIESQLSPALAFGVGVLFAVVSLTKFTFFLLCAASLVTVTVYALAKRRWWRATGLMATYLVSVCLLWCLNGQHLSGVLPFVRGAGEVASGYAGAMLINESWPAFWSSLGALLLGGGCSLVWRVPARRRTAIWESCSSSARVCSSLGKKVLFVPTPGICTPCSPFCCSSSRRRGSRFVHPPDIVDSCWE
jgi:hypothetical protein